MSKIVFKCTHCNDPAPCFAIVTHCPVGCLHDRNPAYGVGAWKKASTSEIKVALGMQSDPAARRKTAPLALNACAPNRLSDDAWHALRTYVEQAQQAITATMTFTNGKLTIKTESVWP